MVGLACETILVKTSLENGCDPCRTYTLKDVFSDSVTLPDELAINWDQTGCKLTPGGNWTIDKKGKQQIPIHGIEDKRQVTVLLSVTKSGTLFTTSRDPSQF